MIDHTSGNRRYRAKVTAENKMNRIRFSKKNARDVIFIAWRSAP